ncbi:MAG TPA: class IV adenylate cyclase [Candidatus Saccharimonas sp.]|nr:class IV adenylate cyclase [Candidatus Saccharimonas sp.]
MREIEIKARVRDQKMLETKLAELGIKLGKPKTHHDVVFCKPGQKDYQKGSIWLRLRTENGKKVIWTLKADTGTKLDSIEHEVEVSNGNELEKMLRLMGNNMYSDLTKTRRKAAIGEVEICLDNVDGLGTYIEVERLVAPDADGDAVRAELWELLAKLGITKADQEELGYDVLLKRAS